MVKKIKNHIMPDVVSVDDDAAESGISESR